MANYSQTVANSLRLFGEGPASQWAQYNWGSFNWGEGTTDMIHTVEKVIANAQASDTAVMKEQAHLIAESLSPTSEMTDEQVFDGSGYNYVFRSSVTNAESRTIPTWAQSSTTASWSRVTRSTTWS